MVKFAKWAGYALGLFMVVMGLMKIFGDVPIFTILENNLDTKYGLKLSWIDPQFKYFTAVLEIISGALLLLGQRFKGGALAVMVIGGAIMTHLFVIGIYTPTSAAADAPLSPGLFITACISFLVALLVTAGSRAKNA
ncbi:hypothetical protein N9W89_04065 [Hellea sp.]|nr:hypothetical protein [Hellea sp.]